MSKMGRKVLEEQLGGEDPSYVRALEDTLYEGLCERCGQASVCDMCSGKNTHKAIVTFATEDDYKQFLILMQDAEEEFLLRNPFTIQPFTIKKYDPSKERDGVPSKD